MIMLICLSGASCAHGLGRAKAQTAEALYTQAVEDMESGLYPEALKEFGEVKIKYPYTRFAALADLRIADTNFRRTKYLEAIDAYRNFLKFHPGHEDAPYALFKVGEAYYEQIPSDWWFLPPGAEKDQSSTRQAISAFEDMLSRFDTGPMADTARERLSACRRKLADHEMYVARFYFSKQRYDAAAGRAEGLLHEYSGLGLDSEALWISGRARLKRGDKPAAAEALGRLVHDFPASPEAPQARRLLEGLGPMSAAPVQEPTKGPDT